MSDFGTVIAPGAVRFERLLPGPVERVWTFLTDPEKRGLWLASGPMELRVGGRVELRFRNAELATSGEPVPDRYRQFEAEVVKHGRVTSCDPPRLLSFTWPEAEGEDSEVTFELSPFHERVRLVLTHRRLARRAAMRSVAGGWHTHLDILVDRLSGRATRPFWSTIAALDAAYDERLPRD